MKKEGIQKEIIKAKVSVIVATYRRDESLKRALKSVINQTYDMIEIIVVDDNADIFWNNKVTAIIKEFSLDQRIKYIQNEINQGSAQTRNIGIVAASGEYITFLDDDDMYLSRKVELQLISMIRENADYSITNLILYNESDKVIDIRRRPNLKETSKENLLKYHIMYHITGTDVMMFKKDYILKIGCFPLINIGDEYYLMEKAIINGGKFIYIDICQVKAYVHLNADGLSSGNAKIRGENELFMHKKKFFKELKVADIRYVKARHFAVLAFVEIRRRNYLFFLKYCMLAFFSSPIGCIKIIKNMR